MSDKIKNAIEDIKRETLERLSAEENELLEDEVAGGSNGVFQCCNAQEEMKQY
ncbi:hypothetical protein [Ferrimonas aestuarii]|uniref:hypothetical protein n=1 Tax=Ferrimonas aestuarii TaxID=2569539 RepID=UPI00145C6938|nr:hypothetical protein [Ferrimonas aestuarii]